MPCHLPQKMKPASLVEAGLFLGASSLFNANICQRNQQGQEVKFLPLLVLWRRIYGSIFAGAVITVFLISTGIKDESGNASRFNEPKPAGTVEPFPLNPA